MAERKNDVTAMPRKITMYLGRSRAFDIDRIRKKSSATTSSLGSAKMQMIAGTKKSVESLSLESNISRKTFCASQDSFNENCVVKE